MMYRTFRRPMEAAIGFLYSLGFFISAMIGIKAEVPDDETKMINVADMPVRNVGLPIIWKP